MSAPVNVSVRVYNYPEARKIPAKKRERTVKKTEEIAKAIQAGHKQIVVNTFKLSKKLLVKLLGDVLPHVTMKVIKAIPGILLLAVA